MEQIKYSTTGEKIKDITNANNTGLTGAKKVHFGMTGPKFVSAINTDMDKWADETAQHITNQSTPESFKSKYNEATLGGREFVLEFVLTPNDATVEVKEGTTVISAESGKYPINKGHSYTYTVSKTGYTPATGNISSVTADVKETITLVEE